MENQEYNKQIERLARLIVGFVKSFIIFPIILMMLTPMGYLASLGTTLIITITKNLIQAYVGKR
jgi:hypothetical protein